MPTTTLLSCCLALFCWALPHGAAAQFYEDYGEHGTDWGGYLFGVQGGLSLGNQDWSNIETEFMSGYHGAVFMETVPANGRFSFFGQLGYYTRGSKISQRRVLDFSGNQFRLPADDFRFQNVSLGLGARSVVAYTQLADLYYKLGVRLEYSVMNNLSEYDAVRGDLRRNYPFDAPDFINEITYGVSFGGGALVPFSNKMAFFLELTAHPDLNFQYQQPSIDIINPGGPVRSTGERMIRNFTIELSFGIRFLRKWDYLD